MHSVYGTKRFLRSNKNNFRAAKLSVKLEIDSFAGASKINFENNKKPKTHHVKHGWDM